MSEYFRNLRGVNKLSGDIKPQEAREAAVAAALAVIHAKAEGGDATQLKVEFDNLSLYADKIQEALQVK